jgi:hypothetical protein
MNDDQRAPEINARSPYYFIVSVTSHCWRCNEETRLYALALPESHETLHVDDDRGGEDRANDGWECTGHTAVIFNVDYLSRSVRRRMRRESTHYWLDLDPGTGLPHFMNHCEHCGARRADRALHEEFPGAFRALGSGRSHVIDLLEVDRPLEAHAAGFAIEPAFSARMRRVR